MLRLNTCALLGSLTLLLGIAQACSSSDSNAGGGSAGALVGDASAGGDGDGTESGDNSDGITGDLGDGFATVPGVFTDGGGALCGDGPCACSNGIDDDGDGKPDGLDEECTGPLDDDESSFATGISGDNQDPKWQDCFFDGNSGAGDDGCRYHTECLTGEREATHQSCTLAEVCIESCQPLTPNGCDCFGCCEVQVGSDSLFITITSSCDYDDIDDEEACPRCVQTTECMNECGECELCPGKTVADLPQSCFDEPPPPEDGGMPPDDPPYTCDGGEAVCVTREDCQAGEYCSFGCCIPSVVR